MPKATAMMNLLRVALLVASLSASLTAGAAGATEYRDKTYGFSVSPPAFPNTATPGAIVQAVLFGGPQVDGFAANCNVQVQLADLTMKQYGELTDKQFASADWTTLDRKDETISGKPAMRWHYSGSVRGRDFEWVAVVIAAPKRFYLLTCTALKQQFDANSKVFEETISSFRVE